ncbi:MAG: hypothetical protein HQK57_12335 [Deltaproteobacteria bacterium]|nr:hypothetical protein [Deltaproteobacteria bacterium]
MRPTKISSFIFWVTTFILLLSFNAGVMAQSSPVSWKVPKPRAVLKGPRTKVSALAESLDCSIQAADPNQADRTGVTVLIEGLNFDDNAQVDGYHVIPPDPCVAAGPNHLVSVINTTIIWYTKAGIRQNVQPLTSFFPSLSPDAFVTDPRVVYDQYQGRFVVSFAEIDEIKNGSPEDNSWILVAVSVGSDPNGGWYFCKINSKTQVKGDYCWVDFPGMAMDSQAVYITGNMFTFDKEEYRGSYLWIISKGVGSGGFYEGGPAKSAAYDPPGLVQQMPLTAQPTHMFGSQPANVGTFLVRYDGLTDDKGQSMLSIISVSDPLGAAGGPRFSHQFVPVGCIDDTTVEDLPGAPQYGTSLRITTNDRGTLQVVWRDNALWTALNVLSPAGPDAGTVVAHWFKINTVNLTKLTLADQGNAGGKDIAPGAVTFFPSISVDRNGNMCLGFALSAPSLYCGAYCAARLAVDPPGTVQPTKLIAAGQDFYIRTFGGGSNRWGDYSGMALDPADETTFWVFNQYTLPRGTVTDFEDGRWGTRMGSFTFSYEDNPPVMKIKGNGATGPIEIKTTDSLRISLSLDPKGFSGKQAAWFLTAKTPFGLYSYTPVKGVWVWQSGNFHAYQGKLTGFSDVPVSTVTGLPEGDYTFVFAVQQLNAQGQLIGLSYGNQLDVDVDE